MIRFLLTTLTASCMLLAGALIGRAADDPAVAADEATLQTAGIGTDGPALLEFFRLRTKGTVAPERLAALLDQLGAKTAAAREKACGELVAIGPAAIPALRQAAKDFDAPTAAALARRCLDALEKNSASISAAAARRLALQKPEGAVEALLTFLPAAEDEHVLEEVKGALITLSFRDGKPVAALVKALEDTSSLRRGSAIEVLGQSATGEPDATFRKLLTDPMPSVRLKASLALARMQDPKAVEIMIGLLAEVPVDQGRPIEEYLYNLAGDTAPKSPLIDEASRAKARDAWAAWWQAHDGANLVAEFRKRTVTETELKKAADLIRKLGDENYDTREDAMQQIRAMGQVAMRVLRDAAKTTDLEVRNRIRDLLVDMERDKSVPLSPVAARVIALRKPAGAAEAILGFIPFTEDQALIAEVQAALNAVAYTDGKLEPVVVRALEDRYPARRGAAAEAICQAAKPEHQEAVRKLLVDADAGVRLKAALALASLRDKAALPVLIAQVREAEPDRAALVEEYLHRIAGDKVPADMPAGYEDEPRQKRSAAWAKWWAANAETVSLPDRQALAGVPRYLGYTLIVQQQQQSVAELGTDGKERWRINGLVNPMDAHVLPSGRVLIAEMGQQRVTERTLKGDIVWQKPATNWPISAERLANGSTLIVTRNQIVEVDRIGKETFTYNRPVGDIMSGFKARDGHYVIISNQGTCSRIDAAGKEVKNFRLQGISNYGNELLPNGNLLVPLSYQNKVFEYDQEGKVVKELNVLQPMAVCRLANGNTLVSTQSFPPKLIELDREGKQVSETTLQSYTTRIRRR